MSVKTALAFMQHLRSQPLDTDLNASLTNTKRLDQLIVIADELGYHGISCEQMRQAFQVDWSLRRIHRQNRQSFSQ